jgi:hypothetical protein|tara:strand:- start:13451 stop:14566 length:1116 start_codon:yes stop_codon:yes gene_type:complete
MAIISKEQTQTKNSATKSTAKSSPKKTTKSSPKKTAKNNSNSKAASDKATNNYGKGSSKNPTKESNVKPSSKSHQPSVKSNSKQNASTKVKTLEQSQVNVQVESHSHKPVNSRTQQSDHKVQKGKQGKSNRRQSNGALDAFISMGITPKSQIFATKKFPIVNRIVHVNLSQLSIIGQNIAGINGGLLRFRALEGIEPFEKYIQTLIENVNTSILTEIAECQGYLNQYKEQGYDFISASEPAICQVKLFNSTSNLLIELYLYLDTLITQINYLEKCNHISTSEKIKIERQWSMLPRHLNSRVLSIKAAIEKKLQVNLTRGNDAQVNIDVEVVKGLFADFTKNKAELTLTYMPPIPEMQNIYASIDQNKQKLA